jgi:hypothetical protein
VWPSHYDSAVKLYCFKKLSPDEAREVESGIREEATVIVDFVCADLSIPEPRVVWITPASPSDVAEIFKPTQIFHGFGHPVYTRIESDIDGFAPNGGKEIWLRIMRFWRLELMAAHELRHVWQKTQGTTFDKEPVAEGDAYTYPFVALKSYLSTKGLLKSKTAMEIEERRMSIQSWFYKKWPKSRFETVRGR